MPPSISFELAIAILFLLGLEASASLILTLAVEVPVAAMMGLRRRREIAAVVCVSLITNPVLIWLTYSLGVLQYELGLAPWEAHPLRFPLVVAVLEVVVVLVEWRLLTWALAKPSRQMLLVSAVTNAASVLVGVLLYFGLQAIP